MGEKLNRQEWVGSLLLVNYSTLNGLGIWKSSKIKYKLPMLREKKLKYLNLPNQDL